VSASDFVKKLHRKTIKNFMDILILVEMKRSSVSGYDVIGIIHKKFGILLSSGTVYSTLYSLERDGLIRGTWNNRKRVYTLTEKAKQKMGTVIKAEKGIQDFLKNISSPNSP
jgi:DNA-binding PadR family transcriptional regulator